MRVRELPEDCAQCISRQWQIAANSCSACVRPSNGSEAVSVDRRSRSAFACVCVCFMSFSLCIRCFCWCCCCFYIDIWNRRLNLGEGKVTRVKDGTNGRNQTIGIIIEFKQIRCWSKLNASNHPNDSLVQNNSQSKGGGVNSQGDTSKMYCKLTVIKSANKNKHKYRKLKVFLPLAVENSKRKRGDAKSK